MSLMLVSRNLVTAVACRMPPVFMAVESSTYDISAKGFQVFSVALYRPGYDSSVFTGPSACDDALDSLQGSRELETVVTANGLSFAFRALFHCATTEPRKARARSLAVSDRHVDILYDFVADNGYMCSLNSMVSVVRARPAVCRDAATTCELIRDIYTLATERGYVKRRTASNAERIWPLLGWFETIEDGKRIRVPRFRTTRAVSRNLKFAKPDQSWMTTPFDIDGMSKWTRLPENNE